MEHVRVVVRAASAIIDAFGWFAVNAVPADKIWGTSMGINTERGSKRGKRFGDENKERGKERKAKK